MRLPESVVKDDIKKVLRSLKLFYWMPNAGPFGQAGVSDFHALYKGHFIAIEAKATAKSKLRPGQPAFMADVSKNGCTALLVHAGNVHLLERALTGIMEMLDVRPNF